MKMQQQQPPSQQPPQQQPHQPPQQQHPDHISNATTTPTTTTSEGTAYANIYAATVNIPAYYTEQKRSNNRSVKCLLRKTAGIPLAVVYGFALYWITTTTILPELHHNIVVDPTNHHNIKKLHTCPNFNVNRTNVTKIAMAGYSDVFRNESDNITTGISHDQLTAYSVSALMTSVGIMSVFSRNTRCCMFLILPGGSHILYINFQKKLEFNLKFAQDNPASLPSS